MLKNSGFDSGDWTRDTHTGQRYGEIYTPAGWVTWFEEGGEFRRPECKLIPSREPFLDPPRVHAGDWAWQAFTMFGRQHAGLYQVVEGLEPGAEYEFTAQAHAWSAHQGELEVEGPHCSAGVGCGPVYLLASDVPPLSGDPQNDAIGNFTLSVGVGFDDPDPFSDAIEWGRGACVYNAHHKLPAVTFVAPDDGRVVVYLRAFSRWPFRTSDAYWDSSRLVKLSAGPAAPRGAPREQYSRTYVLLPPHAGARWAQAIFDAAMDKRWTVGGSADDAGIGDLDERRVIAVNPDGWPGDLLAFFREHYPGVDYVPVEAATPYELGQILSRPLADHVRERTTRGVHGSPVLSAPEDFGFWIRELKAMGIRWYKMLDAGGDRNVAWASELVAADITPIVRLYQAEQCPGRLETELLERVPRFVDVGVEFFEVLNEPNLPCEWPAALRGRVDYHDEALVNRVAASWWADARAVIERGGRPAFPAMAPTERNGSHPQYSSVMWATALLRWLAKNAQASAVDYFEDGTLWLAVHAALFNRRLDFYPFRGEYMDDMCIRSYEVFQTLIHAWFNVESLTISTEGGVFAPDHLRDLGWAPDYDDDGWGMLLAEMYDYLDDRGELAGMCSWILTDEGVADPRWRGNGWYNGKSPRSPVRALKVEE